MADFNLDGNLDILTISNFGDLTDSNFESVVLLTNTGDLNFNANKIKNIPRIGWQTIDVKDFDNDGDKDVFIGAFGIKLGPKESIKVNDVNIYWVRLINKTKKINYSLPLRNLPISDFLFFTISSGVPDATK